MAATALGVLALFLLVSTIAELSGLRFIGSGIAATNTISVNGTGEVFAVPDTAVFSATVRETAKEVKDAQDAAAKKSNDIIAYLRGQGIEEKDIKTADYSVYPQYEYQNSRCPLQGGGVYPCPPGRQILTGFQVSQTLSVKVRDTKKAGDLLSGVGSRGVSEVSGLTFTIDDEDTLKKEARDMAIAQAKEKADALARSLDVSLVRVVAFSESEGAPFPYAMKSAMGMGGGDAAVVPQVPTGENKIVSNVYITFEIK